MKSFNIRTSLMLLLTIPVCCLIILSVISIRTFEKIDEGIGRIYDDRVVPMEQLKNISDAYAVLIIDTINKADHNLIKPAAALESLRQAKTLIKDNLQSYLSTQLTPDEQQLVNQLNTLLRNADQSVLDTESALAKMGTTNNGELNAYNGALYKTIDPVTGKIDELMKLQLHVAKEERNKSLELYNSSRNIYIALAIVVTLSITIVGYLTVNSISSTIITIKDSIERAHKNSDLTIQVNIDRNDELAQLVTAYQKMINHFREIIEQIRQASFALQHESSALRQITQQTNSGALRQQSDADLAATASTEMSATIDEVARNAQQASVAANNATEETNKAAQVMYATMEQFEKLSTQMELTGNNIQQVSADSQSIGSVIDVIRGIADQTNLLALNAAIEAARAGEQGRGFAVVADEVRSLAKRTQDATHEIQGMIQHLQSATSEAVNSTQQVKSMIQQTKDQSSIASNALNVINNAVTLISDMNIQIATATEEQSQVSLEINTNIVNIAAVSHETVQTVQKIDQASGQLTNLSTKLESMVSTFKV